MIFLVFNAVIELILCVVSVILDYYYNHKMTKRRSLTEVEKAISHFSYATNAGGVIFAGINNRAGKNNAYISVRDREIYLGEHSLHDPEIVFVKTVTHEMGHVFNSFKYSNFIFRLLDEYEADYYAVLFMKRYYKKYHFGSATLAEIYNSFLRDPLIGIFGISDHPEGVCRVIFAFLCEIVCLFVNRDKRFYSTEK